MPVLARLDWVLRQFDVGRKGHISFGEARDAKKLKVKIVLEPACEEPPSQIVRLGLNTSILAIRGLAQKHVSVDRGHKHSSGKTEINVWISFAHDKTAASFVPSLEVAALPMERSVIDVVDCDEGDNSVGGGEVLSGVGGDTVDPGPAASVICSEGATAKDKRDDVGDDGLEVDSDDLGLASRVNSCEGATGSIDRSTGVQEEGSRRHKKPRILVEI